MEGSVTSSNSNVEDKIKEKYKGPRVPCYCEKFRCIGSDKVPERRRT